MKDKSFFGVVLILLGIGFLLDQFNIVSFNNLFSLYWPLILIVIGVAGFLNNKTSKIFNAGLVLLGVLFQARNMDIIDINIFKIFWPVILIITGINIIFGKNRENSDNMNKNTSLEEYMDEFAIMSGIETNIASQAFKGGKATAVMGGIEIDLRGAKLYNNEATIEITAIMGGVEIFVPETWKVEHSGTPLLGGFTNKSRQNLELDSPVLKINFTTIMGGVEIK